MSAVRQADILFRSGGAELLRSGVPWRRRRFDGREVEAPTFTRADATTCATYVDRDLTIRTAAAGKLRADWTGSVCSLLLESSRTNICLQSQDFGTTWTPNGTPTRSAAAKTCGILTLDLIGEDSAGAVEYYTQVVTFTGDAVKALAICVAEGTNPAASGSQFGLFDSTAGTYRLKGTLTWASGAPVVVMANGTHLRTVTLASGVYRLEFQSTSVTAANNNVIEVVPAAVSGEQGNLYAGGVQAEDATYPSSYIKTTTGAVTRAADSLTFPIGFAPQDLTVYLRVPRPTHAASLLSDAIALAVGANAAAYPRLTLTLNRLSAGVAANVIDGVGTVGEATASFPAGATVDIVAQFSNLTTAPSVRLDVGSGFGSAVTGPAAITGWYTNHVRFTFGGNEPDAGIHRALIARGLFTLAEMQAVPW